jgi:hypothetical protein
MAIPRPNRNLVYWRLPLALAAAVTCTLLPLTFTADRAAREGLPRSEEGMPRALSEHLEQLAQTIPGLGGFAEGPGEAADQAFEQRAYPGDSVSVAQMDAARSSHARLSGRPFPRGKGRTGTWVSVGPSQALYPLTIFRSSFSYVPADYYAGGRTTAIAIAGSCRPGHCVIYVTPAGGGVWRTKNGLDGQPSWRYLGGPLGINAAGAVTVDPNDATGDTVYVGTGEANVCGSGCVAGVGLYKSTDGGETWIGPLGQAELGGKGIGAVVVKPGNPNTIFAGTTSALRGLSSVCCDGVIRPVPGAAQWGLYRSTDGGATWQFVHNGSVNPAACTGDLTEYNNGGTCSPRGVRHVVLDPTNPDTVYAGSYARGVWRSTDNGTTWTQIKPSANAAVVSTRPAIAVNLLANGRTRMYVHEGNNGGSPGQLFRSDDVAAGAPVFANLSSNDPAHPGFATYNLCGTQCSYDLFVHSPAGYPDIVYAGGSYAYGETGNISNGRAVVLSTDGGLTATDMTMDGTDFYHPNGLHPDQHAIVTSPGDPFQFFETSDGGIMRSSGSFTDSSAWCAARGLTGVRLGRCQQLLSRVPSKLESLNKGLPTLQFQSLSVSPFNANIVQGGTQDNGTWQTPGNPIKWENTMIGDGGQSGFDVGIPSFRFHSFYDASPDVNFSNGDTADWNWISDPIFGHAGTAFYAPIISDPVVSRTMFAGTGRTVYRTKTSGLGTMTLAEFRQHCNEWFGDFPATVTCGDWAELGASRLTSAAFGDRDGGGVAAVERTTANTSTIWAATSRGRVFVTANGDAEPASSVTWTRLDTLAANDPNRFISGIHVNPANPNQAWVSYSGFNSATPATPGHVFLVTWNPGTGAATWADVSYDLGDVPATDVARDDATGDLYASSDFGVALLAAGATTWTLAAPGMPHVEVAGLTVVPGARRLYAATHGLGAWLLNLP